MKNGKAIIKKFTLINITKILVFLMCQGLFQLLYINFYNHNPMMWVLLSPFYRCVNYKWQSWAQAQVVWLHCLHP